MKKALLRFVFIAAFAAAVAWAGETNAPHETTLIVRNGYIIAPIYVYDHWRWFVLDTTRDLTTFHQTFTNHLTAVPTSVVEIMLDAPRSPIYFGPKFFLAGHHPNPKYVLVDDLRPLEELTAATDGILGLNVLTNYAISFDFVNESVRFETNAAPSAEALDLSIAKGNRLAFSARLENGKHIALGIDTANGGEISLNSADWRTAFPSRRVKTKRVMVANASGKFHLTTTARLPILKIGNEVYTNLICTRANSDASVSSVGAAFLQRHRVSIDYRNCKIVLERLVDHKPIENPTGIHLKWIRRGAVVASVDPDSPAAKSGLAEGDEILRIDGSPIWRNKANQLLELLGRGDKEALEIKSLHGTATITNKLDLKDGF